MLNPKRLILSLLPFVVGVLHASALNLPFEKLVLDNGLEVILHEDKSDPIVSVAVMYHVGSNREEKGKTGFAHLFEHMLFQESQHVGKDQFIKKIDDAGGSSNGGTWNDGTVYYEVVPKNALEMVLWMESDRMGYLLSRVTKDAFLNQQNVVQNEKRQRVDNRPYGYTSEMIDKLLYPEDHPYSWQVIGSMEDLTNATLDDIHTFHKKWYGPNNATLVVAGDYDRNQALQWIRKYFGEIKSGEKIKDLKPIRTVLSATKRVYHEDNFAKSPELNMVFPTLENYTDDAYALDLLGELLTDGKKAPLYKVIVEEKKLAPSISGYHWSQELAGSFRVTVRTFPDINLTEVEQAILEAFQRFEKDQFTVKDLDRIKAKGETQFYQGISSVLYKSFRLSSYNEYAGSADYINTDLQRMLAVTPDAIWRVYHQYIQNKPYVLTSFVPKGQANLVAEHSERFPILEEAVEKQTVVTELKGEELKVGEIPSVFDRSVEPPAGPDPLLSLPAVWTHQYTNDLQIYGIQQSELPLISFSIRLKGGMLLDDPEKIGVANLVSAIMMEGTARKTPIELEEAINELGASIFMYTTEESIILKANCLTSKFDKVFQLVQEILFEPRWDEKEFARIKEKTIESIKRDKVNPGTVASQVFNKLAYGQNHKLANSKSGTEESVQAMTMEDMKAFYAAHFSPSVSSVLIVGDIDKGNALNTVHPLQSLWKSKEVRAPVLPKPRSTDKAQIYFVDFPDAKQSQLRVGHLSLPYTHPDYFKTTVMNYKLGECFGSKLNMILREEKGFTYGAGSYFSGSDYPGTFVASTAVRSTATLESIQIIKDVINTYRQGITDEELQLTKNALIKINALKFETLGDLMYILAEMADYDFDADYIKQQEETVRTMSRDDHVGLAQKYIQPDRMIYLVVGDAKTQLAPLAELGYGTPIILDADGNKK